jgi:MFS family permease
MKLFDLYLKSFQGLNKEVWYIALIYLINRCGEMVIPFMSLYLTSELGFSKTQSGIVLFCFGLGALMGSNIGGYLTDIIGNFKVMAISLLGMAICFTCIVLFQEFYMLCTWMIITASFSSMFSPAAFSAVSLWGNPENKTRGFSLLRMAINLGVAIGPAIGGFLAGTVGYRWLFIGDGFTSFLAFIALFFVLGHRNVKKEIIKKEDLVIESPYRDGILLLFLLFNLFNMIAFFQILFSVPVYFKEIVELDEKWIGIFFTVNGLLVFFLEMPLVYIIEQKNKYFKPLVGGAFLIGLGYALLALVPNPLVAIALYSLLVALGEVINFPLIPSLVMRRATEQNQGKYMGVVSMMFALAFLFAPVSGLPVIEIVGFHTYWYLAAAFSMVSAICLWLLRSHFVTLQN